MSYTFLLEQGEEFSVECFLDIPAYVLSRLNLTVEKSCCKDSGMESSQDSQSGMMSALLTEIRGEGKSMSSPEDSLVRTSAQETPMEKGFLEREADYGESKPELFARLDHVLSLWKTPHSSLDEDLILFSGTWPKWGIMQNGECFQLKMLADGTCENECGFSLPTIGKNEFKGTSAKRYWGSPDFRGAKMGEGVRTSKDDPIYLSPSFSEASMMWPIMWTALAPLGTDKTQEWWRSLGGILMADPMF